MAEQFGKGFSEDTLKNVRKFYLTYKGRISETVFSPFAEALPDALLQHKIPFKHRLRGSA
ncbi:MAG: hypothetical protein HXK90_01665 [Lachnospiraceae bacterium]|nr:hypothetical protein [Lachnospiraceae bacterium]